MRILHGHVTLPKHIFFIPILVSVLTMLTGCAATDAVEREGGAMLRIKGSDTMLHLTTRWAEEFMRLHPRIAVYVEGGGTGTGIEALIEGDVDLCAASRTFTPDEVRRLLRMRGSLGISILTAKDALSVYLHSDNPIRILSMEQISGLFTGRIRNWNEVGGANLPVTVISRQPNSGTYLFFEEHVLRGQHYRNEAEFVPTTQAVAARVRELPAAIGYGGLPFGDDLVHVAVDGIEPTALNVRNGTYPIARYLYLYAAKPLDGNLKLFVDWVLSSAGQSVVRETGYIPLWEVPEDEP